MKDKTNRKMVGRWCENLGISLVAGGILSAAINPLTTYFFVIGLFLVIYGGYAIEK